MQVGSLVAFLSYLIQILMAVMMGTFVAHDGSACVGVRRRASRRCSTRRRRSWPPDRRRHRAARARRRSSCATSSSRTPAPSSPCSRDITFRVDAGQTLAIIGSTGSGKTTLLNLVARLFDVTGGEVLIGGVDVRDLDTRSARAAHRARAPEAVPVLGHRGEQPALRQPGRHRRRGVGGTRGRAGARLRRGQARPARLPDRAGRHQRVGRPAPAARHRPGPGPQARHLPLRRLVLRPRPRDRRPPARRAGAGHRATR